MSTLEIGKKLVEYCKANKNRDAIEELYSHHIVSVEPMAHGQMPARIEGIKGVREKTEWWYANHTVHSSTVNGPWPHGDRFIVQFIYEITPKAGPMAGKRMTMDECGLFTVKDGKVIQEEFFYPH